MKAIKILVVLFTLLALNIPVCAEDTTINRFKDESISPSEDYCNEALAILIDNRWLLVDREDVSKDYFAFINASLWDRLSSSDKVAFAVCVKSVYNAKNDIYVVNLGGTGSLEDVFAVYDKVSFKVYR